MPLTDEEKSLLEEQGLLVVHDAVNETLFDEVEARIHQLYAQEGDAAGREFNQEPGCRRLANLVNKGGVFARAIAVPRLLECVRHVLGPRIKLSSLNARSVDPHSCQSQPLHADMGAVADEQGYWVCNIVWMLDDFTPDNGAIRIVPGSHRWRQLPQDVLDDPHAPHPLEQLVTGRRGTLVVMNAHMWHAGTANRTPRTRTAMHAFYCRADRPQQQYQRQLLSPEVQARLTPELRELLALDDPLNDELSAAVTVRSGFLK